MSTSTDGGPTLELRLLRKLIKGLDKRLALPGGAAREGLDAHLVEVLDNLAVALRADPDFDGAIPPRPIAIAMALAVFSQPHLSTTMGLPEQSGTLDVASARVRRPDPPLLTPTETLAECLGLDQWQLDELREEVDRRVGDHLMRLRCVNWVWAHFGMPEASADTLFRVLFPGAPGRTGPVHLLRRGARLYAVVEQLRPPEPSALYLSWLSPDDEDGYAPLGGFQSRYVDAGLRHTLTRSVGTLEQTIDEILDDIVTIIPRRGVGAFIEHDLWRIRALESVTQLSGRAVRSRLLADQLTADAITTDGWLVLEGGHLVPQNARVAFDALALPRVTAMLRQIYASMLARLTAEEPMFEHDARFKEEDLVLYDVGRHLRACLEPLLGWLQSPQTVGAVADRYTISRDAVTEVLTEVGDQWRRHAEATWYAGPRKDGVQSVEVRLTEHLVRTHDSLHRLYHRPPTTGTAHRDALLLFAGHYFAEAGFERLWTDDAGLTDDPIGRWFWPAWTRLTDLLEGEYPSAYTMEIPSTLE